MSMLLIKAVTIITVVHGVRLVARSMGPRWSGLLLGLPISTALVLGFLGSDRGDVFAAAAAGSGLLGLIAAVLMALVYAVLSSGRGQLSTVLAAAVGAFLVTAAILQCVAGLSVTVKATMVLATIVGAALVASRAPARALAAQQRSPSRLRMLVLRTVVPLACLLPVMTLAQHLGPTWAGLLGTFPATLTAVLVVTHLESGPLAAAAVARAFPLGNMSMVSFVIVFHEACPSLGWARSLLLGYLAALTTLVAMEKGRALLHRRSVGPAVIAWIRYAPSRLAREQMLPR